MWKKNFFSKNDLDSPISLHFQADVNNNLSVIFGRKDVYGQKPGKKNIKTNLFSAVVLKTEEYE